MHTVNDSTSKHQFGKHTLHRNNESKKHSMSGLPIHCVLNGKLEQSAVGQELFNRSVFVNGHVKTIVNQRLNNQFYNFFVSSNVADWWEIWYPKP